MMVYVYDKKFERTNSRLYLLLRTYCNTWTTTRDYCTYVQYVVAQRSTDVFKGDEPGPGEVQ